jgi:cytochrome c oxidase subunit 2
LWWFAYKYRYKKGNKAFYFAHNNKLEIAWTIFPAIIFTGLIFYGLSIWNKATTLPSDDEDKIVIELYARQFDWTARYTGADGVLGEANYTMIAGNNSLGIVMKETIEDQLIAIGEELERIDKELAKFPTKDKIAELETAKARSISQLKMVSDYKRKLESQTFNEAYDDIVINPGGEIHIPKGKKIELKMRSQDVIHSAYLPHFRVHMYCVPGLETSFSFVPTMTTFEMQEKLGNRDFDFLLFCNNICGAAHWNMQMNIIVQEEADFNRWLSEQKSFREVYIASN